MRRISAVAALAAAGLVLTACGGGSDDGDNADAGGDNSASKVEVFTWWAAGSELTGLQALEAVFAEQHPDTEFINGAVAGGAGSAAKDLLQTRLQAGDPPDTFQAHAGMELQDYIDAGQLEDVSGLYDEFGLNEVFPQDLLDLLTVDGKIYSVPSNIHRSNVVWANPEVLEAAGVDPAAVPEDIDAWIADLQKVADSGATALSVAAPWTQVNLLETVLMADLGAEGYNGLWNGSTDWASAEVTGALEHFETLIGFTNTDRDGLDWPDATQKVIDGVAGYNVMGDWAVALFEENDIERGTGFVDFPVPGSDEQFGFLADSFTLPVGAKHAEGAKAWLETIGSLEGQVAFNKAKGSIPARTDADPSEFSEYQQTAIESYANDTIVPSLAHGAAAPVAVLNGVTDAVSKFTAGGSDLATFQSELGAAVNG
ncbi:MULTISPECIES: ABC transporter substrate-binding protein [unclassified Pseudactinotalea]|uniref:ABC transporter substrate-binding protein n=1 Tax=unclassified Pseudactinotalea TaxID=2649176 RepID=UPI00128E92D8|nr:MULTISPECIES: ABC transporter substrate-binding protein [unclassified Pseudactinotalea]MPV49550.1 extracellular solute-binding protein [Pseudactinotalea sp. HY160]QGH69854.1 extracellular solute-binding protein [Pseudactinotalea sp. HY158]